MKMHIGAALAAVLFASAVPALASPESIAHAISDPSRPKADRDTDARRQPYKTILFAGVKEGDVVGELFPGGGYYTRMLSDVVGPKGKVYALETTRWPSSVEATKKVLDEKGRGNVHLTATTFG